MAFRTYDAAGVTVTFRGHSITGFADGSFITVTQNENSFNLQVGSDGETVRSRSNNRSGTITLSLIHTSASNNVLKAIHNEDLRSRSREQGAGSEGAGVAALQIKDLNGNTLINAANCWISKFPDVEFDRDSTTRAWELMADALVYEDL